MSTSVNELRLAVENALRTSVQPMLSGQVFVIPSVNKHTTSMWSVANCLAMLWREGHLTRVRVQDQHTQECNGSWAYGWKHEACAHLRIDETSGSRTVHVDAIQPKVTPHLKVASLPEILESVRGGVSWCRYMATLKDNT